jgi:MFS family permease
MLLDTTPLKVSRDFRRLWCAQAVSFFGVMITTAALPYQVYHQTGSSFAVGVLGVVQLVPLLGFSLIGGALADSLDKRRLLLTVTALQMVVAALLAANAGLDEPRLWAIFLLGAVQSAVGAASFSVLRSLLPLLLEEEHRPAGFALQSTYGSFGLMAGPALGGLIIAARGLSTAYAVDVVTYVVALAVLVGIAPSPPVAAEGSGDGSFRASVFEGLRYLRRHKTVMQIFGIDLLAMTFGMPRALFPALAERLGGGARLYGLLLASVAAGMFLASLVSGWTSHVRRQGRAVLVAVAVWGGAIAIAGLVRAPAVVLALLAVAGGADMISGVFRSTIAAAVTPDELRGRVSGVEFAVYAGGPVLGDIEAGLVGGALGVPFAIVSGGLACVVAAGWFAARVRGLADYVATPSGDRSPTNVDVGRDPDPEPDLAPEATGPAPATT